MASKFRPAVLWDTGNAELIAKWMFVVSTLLTSGDGSVAIWRGDYLTGLLGISAALAAAAGAIATDRAAKVRDEKQNNLVSWNAENAARNGDF